MSMALHGIGVGEGIVIGRTRLVSQADIEITHYVLRPEDVDAEVRRFEAALAQTGQELNMLRSRIPAHGPAELSAFIDLHMMLLQDYTIAREPIEIIQQEQCNAEWALKLQRDSLMAQFEEIEDNYLRERSHDIRQVIARIFKALNRKSTSPSVNAVNTQNTVLVAHDLSPADLVFFKEARFAAFMTDIGGPASHTAILARSLEIPAVVALGNSRNLLQDDEMVIVDSVSGVIIANPDARTIREYTTMQKTYQAQNQALQCIRLQPAVTRDGTDIEVLANIELPEDTLYAMENGAKGIGLFRSEFLFLSADCLPDEERQFIAYRQTVENMQGYPVVIRTLDLGKDKIPKWGEEENHALNPALGLAGIRLCLAEPKMFYTQLRALLRASHYGEVKLLLPMLSQVREVIQARLILAEAKESLRREGIPFNAAIELGGMIETPAAAVTLSHFLPHLDFISIGTNDLIQYTLAVDRNDDTVSHLYDPLHPAILELLRHTIHTANVHNTPVAICGEMAGDPFLTRLLLALGLRRFSMLPAQLLKVKKQILETSIEHTTEALHEILASHDPQATRSLIKELNQTSC